MQTTRREALTGAAGIAAALHVHDKPLPRRQVDVVVIGAGVAGLMCARLLRAAGRHVVVLEARGRVGGRALSVAGPGETPWTASGAAGWDGQTIEPWKLANMQTDDARFAFDLSISGVYGADGSMISLLDLLQTITSVGGNLQTATDDAQTTRFVGGAW